MTFAIETYELIPNSTLNQEQKVTLLNKGFPQEQIEEVTTRSFYDFLIEHSSGFESGRYNFDEAKQLSYYGKELYAKVKEINHIDHLKALTKRFQNAFEETSSYKNEDKEKAMMGNFLPEIASDKKNGFYCEVAKSFLEYIDLDSQINLLMRDNYQDYIDDNGRRKDAFKSEDLLKDPAKLEEYEALRSTRSNIDSKLFHFEWELQKVLDLKIDERYDNETVAR